MSICKRKLNSGKNVAADRNRLASCEIRKNQARPHKGFSDAEEVSGSLQDGRFCETCAKLYYMKKWFMIFDRYFLPPYNKIMLS